MTREEKENRLKALYWDYIVDPGELLNILSGVTDPPDELLTKNRIFLRMVERLSWLDIVQILNREQLKELINKDFISKIRRQDLKERYELIRKVLHGEPVSFTGWGDEYYQKIKHTLLSNRWYRA